MASHWIVEPIDILEDRSFGSTELLEVCAFSAVAVLELTLHRIEEIHHFHQRLHDFSEYAILRASLDRSLAHCAWHRPPVALRSHHMDAYPHSIGTDPCDPSFIGTDRTA